jgi:hypothetical protein
MAGLAAIHIIAQATTAADLLNDIAITFSPFITRPIRLRDQQQCICVLRAELSTRYCEAGIVRCN